MNMKTRPLVQDLVKQAMENVAQRAQIASEGARQMKLAEAGPVETAAQDGVISTEYAMKLAAALEYAGPGILAMAKRAETSLPEGVTHSAVGGSPPGPNGQGHGHAQPPMHPGMQSAGPHDPATQMDNTLHEYTHGVQATAMSGGKGKTASSRFSRNVHVLRNLVKEAVSASWMLPRMVRGGVQRTVNMGIPIAGSVGAGGVRGMVNEAKTLAPFADKALVGMSVPQRIAEKKNMMSAFHNVSGIPAMQGAHAMQGMKTATAYIGLPNFRKLAGEYDDFRVKQAEDAINPARISAGPAVPPDTSASGEAGGEPVGGAPQGPRGLVGSNEAAINYKRQAAYAPRKSELKAYFSEPALTSSTDSTLNQAFSHTGEAGTKLSSAQLVKSAAARALLSKLASNQGQ